MAGTILFVEVRAAWRTVLRRQLQREGYVVQSASSASHVFDMTAHRSFDVIVLETTSPPKIAACCDVRRAGRANRVLVLPACTDTQDIVAALNAGADDYVTNPANARDVLTRIEVLRRRPRMTSRQNGLVYEFGAICVDVKAAEASRKGAAVNLFAREFRLLRFFVEHPGVTFSRQELLSAVWGRSSVQATRTVDMHIASLRRKLEDQPRRPRHFLTVHRLGYKFKP